MEQNETQEFTKENIIAYLHTKSICGCIDSYRLSELLGTVSQRMIRKFTGSGKLKPLDHTSSYYIYKVDDVAEWLLKYPCYLFKRKKEDNSDLTPERITQLTDFIRGYVKSSWSGILKHMEMEDVIMEVLTAICRHKRKNVSDATLVYRALCNIHKKSQRQINSVAIDPNQIEAMNTGDESDEY